MICIILVIIFCLTEGKMVSDIVVIIANFTEVKMVSVLVVIINRPGVAGAVL